MTGDEAMRRVLMRLRRKVRHRQLGTAYGSDWHRATEEVMTWLDRELAKLPAKKRGKRCRASN